MRCPLRALSLLIAITLVPLPASAADEQVRQVRITAAVANVRSGPSPGARIVFQLRAGDLVRLTETSEQWYGIEAPDGRKGYVFHRLGEVVEPPPPVPPPAPAAADAPPLPSPASGASALGIEHQQIGCVVAGLYPKMDACLVPPDNLGKAEIHFRGSDNEPWYGVALAADGPCHSAFLPKPQRSMAEFQYYVAAVDRSFAEHVKPDAGPASPYRVRVVQRDRDCGSLARLAYSAGKVAKPIIVAVVRDPAGRALAAGALQAALLGFAQEGVILASSAAASASTAASATAAGAGGGGTGGGIGTTTLAVAGGAVAAAVVVAKVAGGGSDSGGSNSGSGGGGGGGGGGATPTPTPTPTPAPTLTGNWAGTEMGTGRATGFGLDITVNCTTAVSGPFQHSGTALTGTLTYGSWACSPSSGVDFVPPAGSQAAFSGTASNGQITVASPSIPGCANTQSSGTYTSTTMDLSFTFQCNIEGFNVNVMGVIRLMKQ